MEDAVDSNVIALRLGPLLEDAQEATGDACRCGQCEV